MKILIQFETGDSFSGMPEGQCYLAAKVAMSSISIEREHIYAGLRMPIGLGELKVRLSAELYEVMFYHEGPDIKTKGAAPAQLPNEQKLLEDKS